MPTPTTIAFSTIGEPVQESDALGWCVGPDSSNALQLHTVDNHVYGMADQTFFRIVPTTHAVETLGATTGADRGFVLISSRDEMYFADGASLMRATISRSSNAAIAGGRVF